MSAYEDIGFCDRDLEETGYQIDEQYTGAFVFAGNDLKSFSLNGVPYQVFNDENGKYIKVEGLRIGIVFDGRNWNMETQPLQEQ